MLRRQDLLHPHTTHHNTAPLTPCHSDTHTLMRGAGHTAHRPAHTTLRPARVVSSSGRAGSLTNKLHRAVAAGRSKHSHNQQLKQPVTCKAATPLAAGTELQLAEPHNVFLARLAWEGVLLPVLASWLFVTALSTVASRARRVGCPAMRKDKRWAVNSKALLRPGNTLVRPVCVEQLKLQSVAADQTVCVRVCLHRLAQWCDENPDEPLSIELLGLLPAALESPTRVAVALFATTR